MVTVYEALSAYCLANKLGVPTLRDLQEIGRSVAKHFRNTCNAWALSHLTGDGPIADTGLVKETQPHGEGEFISTGYPDSFRDEIRALADYYYSKKVVKPEPEPEKAEEKKKRKRIPVKK